MNCEDLEKVIIGDDLERFFQVGARLPLQEKEELVELLRDRKSTRLNSSHRR